MAHSPLARAALLIASLLGPACHGERDAAPRVDSNTNWLRACDDDRACPDALTCVCGQCTRACAEQACPGELVCAEPARWAGGGSCAEPARPYCGAPCTGDSTCAAPSQHCVLGLCVPVASALDPAAGSEGSQTLAEGLDSASEGAGDGGPPAESAGPSVDVSPDQAPVQSAEPGLDGGPGLLASALGDASAAPADAEVQWEAPGLALLSVCTGSVSYPACVNTRVVGDAEAGSQIDVVPLQLRDDGLVYLDSHSASAGALGSWTRLAKGLSVQLDDPAGVLAVATGTYTGAPDGLCFEGVAPGSEAKSFRLCGR